MRSTPPLVRARFLREWDGRSLATLFTYTRQTMPEDNPGSMTDQEFVDVIAYMLSFGGMPAGDDELPPDPLRPRAHRHPAAVIRFPRRTRSRARARGDHPGRAQIRRVFRNGLRER